jgi:phage protein D
VKLETDPAASAAEVSYPYVQQENQYDLNFLIGRARRQGYDLFVKEIGASGRAQDSTLFFGPSVNLRRVTYKLTWGKSLVEFQPNLTTANQVGQVIVRGWDPVRKVKIEGTATRKDLKTQGLSSPGGMDTVDQSFSQRQEVIASHPIASKAEAKKLAIETLQRIANDMVRGTGSTIGLPDLRAGSVVDMEELGRFGGRYFVTSTTHVIADGGYTTQFECRREELRGA